MSEPIILWLRQDLRLSDHPALARAIERRAPVIPAFIWSPEEEGAWPPGAASRWWLHHSLTALDAALRRAGSRLVIRHGPVLPALRDLARETGARTVLWSRCFEPARIATDSVVQAALREEGCEAEGFGGALLAEPHELRTGAGGPYKVFTPFWRALLAGPRIDEPLPAPRRIPAPAAWPQSLPIDELRLLPAIPWDGGLQEAWTPGEAGALRRLADFADGARSDYASGRDAPGRGGTSRLSPHLHWGEISPRQAWTGALRAGAADGDPWLRQLAWREFAMHSLVHFPSAPDKPLREEFAAFPWRRDARGLRAWQRGRTGYPLVDAGMRELWATGWMHDRVRMVAASFLIKHLLLPWQEGERWFWDTLVDADLANNAMSWQWVAGSGMDAAPYFRIFNPVIQGQKFDADGAYVRRWIPELAQLPDRELQAPWLAPPLVLEAAGVRLGKTYPLPIVDHRMARERALQALGETRRAD